MMELNIISVIDKVLYMSITLDGGTGCVSGGVYDSWTWMFAHVVAHLPF